MVLFKGELQTMKIKTQNRLLLLGADAVIILICIAGVYALRLKPFFPFKVSSEHSNLIVTELTNPQQGAGGLAIGDTILSVDGYEFRNWEEAELYMDTKQIGSRITVEILKNGAPIYLTTKLGRYYSDFAIFVISIVSLLFIFLALFVELKSEDKSARLFHWTAMGLVAVISLTRGAYFALPRYLSLFNHFVYLLAFNITPVIFLHFTLVFTATETKFFKNVLKAFYVFATALAFYLFVLYYGTMELKSFEALRSYVIIYTFVFRPFLLISVLTALGLFFSVYRQTQDLIQRRKLNWLLLGFLIGPATFVLLWALPMIVLGRALMGEALMHVLLAAVPITFAIAILKYRLLDINLLLNRSFVYTIVLAGVILLYILIFSALTFLIKGVENIVPAMAAAIVISLFLTPIKDKAQRFVDRKFFRIEYDFREEQKKYLNDIKNSADVQSLVQKMVEHTNKLIPVERIGFFAFADNGRMKLLAGKNVSAPNENLILIEKEIPDLRNFAPLASPKEVEPGLGLESLKAGMLGEARFALVFPLKYSDGKPLGFFALGRKKSGLPFNKDEIDLLNSVATTVEITIERIRLQEKLIREQLEAERLEELNKIKSFFVSTVSHELKTPLTSIQMFTEMILNDEDISGEKIREYLTIINGETERLKKLIGNILNFAKIEKGLQIYNKAKVELNSVVEKVAQSMSYQFEMAKIEINLDPKDEPLIIFADADAIGDAVTNLLSNAIKYSPKNSTVKVRSFERNNFACVSVRDEGAGIAEEQIDKIFEPFYRADEANKMAEGAGLGLAIVKHIVQAHGGRIEVASKLGKGSKFILFFPLEKA